jgi:transposase
MIAAISTSGKMFFTINQGKNNSASFLYFIVKLCKRLDLEDPSWRTKLVLLLDNASIHRSRETMGYMKAFGIPLMFLAPYSFKMAAVEKLFAFVKNRDLNPLTVRAYSR